MKSALAAAMWAGDLDALQELAPCGCCCWEHTHAWCPAREWGGCRSGLALGETLEGDVDSWAAHYEKFHGMTRAVFDGIEWPR